MTVLFTSQRPLSRAENIRALYNAYPGKKDFIKLDWYRRAPEIISGRYDLMVTDEIPAQSPGKVIFIQHGITGGKYYGLDQPSRYATKEQTALITYAITQSKEMVNLTAKQLSIPPERVLPLGMPRTDYYIGKRKGEGGTPYADKRVYLYAPTYRTRAEEPKRGIDWFTINEALDDNEILIVKPHMLTNGQVSGSWDHIIEVSNLEPSTPYLIDADVVITDYSTILFDAYVLHKPAVLFSTDNGYIHTRGMYFNYPDGYSPYYCDSELDLIKTIRSVKWGAEFDRRRRFFAPTCDGESCSRIVNLIQEALNNENTNSGANL